MHTQISFPSLISRRSVVRQLSIATAGALVAPRVLSLMSNDAHAALLGDQSRDVLNFALTLERLESGFYAQAVKTDGLIPPEHQDAFSRIAKNEALHVTLLGTVLLGQIDQKTEFDYMAGGRFPDVFSNFQTFLSVAQTFEDTGVRAYKGQAPNLMPNKLLLTVALKIHSVEARHAAQIRRIRGEKAWITGSSRGSLSGNSQASYDGDDSMEQGGVNLSGLKGVPNSAIGEAFDEPLTKEQVLAIVQPFIKNG